jgi:CBS domain-containing protein
MVSVMTPFPYHIDAAAKLASAWQLMEEHGIRHLPVFENGDIIGIVSERDLERAHTAGHPLREETELLVGDLCTHRPYFVDVADPLHAVLDVMAETRLGSVLVLKEGELAGLFTAVDACRLLSKLLLDQFGPTPPGTEAA